MKIGETIRRLRIERELTQEKLAGMIGITSQAVSKWEREDGLPDITLLPALAAALDCSTDELLGVQRCLSQEELNEIERRTAEIILGDQSAEALKNPRVAEGLAYLREELKKHPTEWYIHLMLAGFLHLGGDDEGIYRERLEHYEYVRQHAPDISSRLAGVVGLVNTYADAGEFEKAEEAAKELAHPHQIYSAQAIRFLRGDRLREFLRNEIITGVLYLRDRTYQFTRGVYDTYTGKHDKSHTGPLDEQLELVELAVKALEAMRSTGWGADWGVFASVELWHGAELALEGGLTELALDYIERSVEQCRPKPGEKPEYAARFDNGEEESTEKVIPSARIRETVCAMMENVETNPALALAPLVGHPRWKAMKEELLEMGG